MPEPVTCKGCVRIRRVLAPRLIDRAQPRLDFRPASAEKRPQDRASGAFHRGMNAAQPLRPRPAQQLVKDSLRLIIKRVRGSYRVRLARLQQLAEPSVAQVSRRLLDRLAIGAGSRRVSTSRRWNSSSCAAASADTNSASPSASAPRMPWCTCATKSTRPISGAASIKARSNATESAPPETATVRRMPGCRSWRSICGASDIYTYRSYTFLHAGNKNGKGCGRAFDHASSAAHVCGRGTR